MKKTNSVTYESHFSEKLHYLWLDNRNYKQRLFLSLITTFSICFTFLFFGPVEITAFGQSSLVFNVKTMLPIMSILSFLIFLFASLILSAFKGKIFNCLLSIEFSLLICGYIQGNFLNGTLGALTGAAIKWQYQKIHTLLNLLIWFAICIAIFLVLYFNKMLWKKILIFVSIALVIMQSVALISIFTGTAIKTGANKNNYLTTTDLTTYAPKHNTIVFLMDRLDYDYIEQVLKDDPNFFNKLDGFTSYTNAISEHARTMPAINYMFTNDDQAWKMPTEEYFEKSWNYNNKNILKDLKSANYTMDFYTEIECMFGSGENVKNYISNLSCNDCKLNVGQLIKNLTYLSAYRYMPVSLKPSFWCYTDDINNNIYKNGKSYQIDETQFDQLNNFNIANNTNYFKFIHFQGSHDPYVLNADGTKSPENTDVVKQTEGSFNILFRVLQKMKQLGIYKDASIIITADHGNPVSDYLPLQKANRIGFFYKPSESADKPLAYSHAPISFKNVPATVAKSAGLDYHKYGTPVDEVGENANVTRYFYKSTLEGSTEKKVYTYQIDGDAADFKNWKIIKVEPAYYSYW